MRADVRDICHPDLVGFGYGKLLLQSVRGNNAWRPRTLPRTAIADLSPQACGTHQTPCSMLTAALADGTRITVDLAVPIDAAALQPELLDQSGQPFVGDRSLRAWSVTPRVVATRIHVQQAAKTQYRQAAAVLTNKGVPQPGWLAKYTATFLGCHAPR